MNAPTNLEILVVDDHKLAGAAMRCLLEENPIVKTVKASTQNPVDRLTRRESEVVKLILEGLSNKQVAEKVEISEKSASVHRCRAFQRMGKQSDTELLNKGAPE